MTRLIRVADDLDKLFGTRAENGDRLTYEWGEPDAEGIYEPTITRRADDNLITTERERIRRGVRVSRSASPIFAHVDALNLGRVLDGKPWKEDR